MIGPGYDLPVPSFRDLHLGRPDYGALRRRAASQDGLFTVEQGRECGFDRTLLSHYARAGRFGHPRRGIYRWPEPDDAPGGWNGIPRGRFERVRLEWMTAGPAHATVSHTTALWLLGLIDLDPGPVHVTLARARRGTVPSKGVQRRRGVRIHLPSEPIGARLERHGMPVTAVARSIADAAKAWASPYVIAEAVERTLAAASADPGELVSWARRRGSRVHKMVEAAIAEAATSRPAPAP